MQLIFSLSTLLKVLNTSSFRFFLSIIVCIFSSTTLVAQSNSQAQSKVTVQECPKIEEYDISGEPPEIKFEQKHLRTVLLYLESLNYYHFNKLNFDDEFSADFLNAYLDRLDPNKAYLLQTDIKLIKERYYDMMDDHFRQINLSPLTTIYTWYRSRAINQLNRNINILKDPKQIFDFDTNKNFLIDTEQYKWHKNFVSAADYWNRRLILEILNLKLSGSTEQEAREKLVRRYKSQLSYIKQEKPIQALETYLNVVGSLYDPHTNYFSPQVSENFEINISLSLEGIGAVLQTQDEFTRVVRIVPGGPADLEGTLQPDDRIVSVREGQYCDPIDLVGLRIGDVVKYIRGAKGSQVQLEIIPAKYDSMSEKREIVTITRDRVKLEENAAKSEVIEVDGESDKKWRFGVIEIPSFYADGGAIQRGEKDYSSTSRDVKKLIAKLVAEDKIDGLVIDLRQNGGGILNEVVSLTDLFIDSGPVVQIKSSHYRNVSNQRATHRRFYSGPLVVLIDRLSASASEIFAAAIQDYGRGVIVGSQSFGKGTVQSVKPLPLGKAKITESKFYRVSGGSTQLKGVYPDIALPDLFNAEDIGESALDNPLIWDTVRPIVHDRYELKPLIEQLRKKHQKRLKTDIDLKYLQNQIAISQERRDRDSISLNEEFRIAYRHEYEEKTLNNENNWRKAKGLPLKPPKLKDEDKLKDAAQVLDDDKKTLVLVANDNNQTAKEADAVEDNEELPDVLLNETINIITNWAELVDEQRLARKKTNKNNNTTEDDYANYLL